MSFSLSVVPPLSFSLLHAQLYLLQRGDGGMVKRRVSINLLNAQFVIVKLTKIATKTLHFL